MAENPLLPNAELRALQQLLVRATDLSSAAATPALRGKRAVSAGAAPALLAGTLLQLCTGDLLVPLSGDENATQLVPQSESRGRGQGGASTQMFPADQPALMLACGLAAALKRAGSDRLVLAFSAPGPGSRNWVDALSWAQQETLPLILACAESNGEESLRSLPQVPFEDLSWSALQRSANRLKLPVLTVDGEDAVAVYRVMQESVLRARAGGGPAVLWAVLPQGTTLRRKRATPVTPLGRLEQYLRSRNIAFG